MTDPRRSPAEGDGRAEPASETEWPVPPMPAWLAEQPARTDAEWARDRAEWQEAQARRPAPDRFEAEFGVPWLPEARKPEGSLTEVVAEAAQGAVLATAEMLRLAEAHRMVALVTAYECAVEDLSVRFGSRIGSRTGLGAQAFFTSMGLQLQQHPARIAHEVDTAVAVMARLPRVWDLFRRGGASWARVDVAASVMDGLDREHWAAYDAAAATALSGSTRLKHDLRVQREQLQADSAARRARTTLERRSTGLELGHDGEASLVITGPAAALIACNDALHAAAVAARGLDGETRGIGQLRHDIAVDVLVDGLRTAAAPNRSDVRVPLRKGVAVTLALTAPALAWLGRSKEQAVLGGYGPIAMDVARELAADAGSFVRVLTDPHTGVRIAMDRKVYAPPADLARWVRVRDGRSRFPGSTTPARLADVDHAREWQHGGPTDASNLITLDRRAHLMKSVGLWGDELLDTGVVGITDAWGHRFEDPPEQPVGPPPLHLLPRRDDDPDAPPPF